MFLVLMSSKFLLIGLLPESETLLLCGVTLVGSALAARRIFKRKDDEQAARRRASESETEK